MITDPRIFSILDDFDDFPFDPIDPSLHIPPLQDPSPLVPSHRPSPLEPIAQVADGTKSATAKFTSRSKALAEAKAIGEDVPERGHGTGGEQAGVTGYGSAPRKRQKLDYVQLPKPTARAKAAQLPPFEPVSILNELHEPPPSAARFPPITPGLGQSPKEPTRSLRSLRSKTSPTLTKQTASVSSSSGVSPANERQERVKRVYLRGRRKWTDEETECLLNGVGIYGVGKWKKILNHSTFSFHPERTTVDLKDRYRTCRMHEEKAIERHASGEVLPLGFVASSVNPKQQQTATAVNPQGTEPVPDGLLPKVETTYTFADVSTVAEQGELVSTKTAKASTGTSKPATERWTLEEDTNLSKGFQRYGFQWTAIIRDPEMKLKHRTANQVRDRFRLKFPLHYQSSVPIPLPDPQKRQWRTQKRSGPKPNKEAGEASPQRVPGAQTLDLNKGLGSANAAPATSMRKAKHLSMTELISPPLIPDPSTQQPRINVLPLSDPSHSSDHSPPSPNERPSSPGSEYPSSDEEDDDEYNASRESSVEAVEAEEARHLSVLGLLNDRDEQVSKLPSFRSTYEEWGTDGVTLPPLLWEDMAARPIFDFG